MITMIRNTIIYFLIVASAMLFSSNSFASNWGANKSGQETSGNADSNTFQRLYIGLNGGFSLAMFSTENSTTTEWQSNTAFNIIPSLDITFLFTQNIGAGIGLRLGKYSSNYTVAGLNAQLEREFVDIDEDTYFPIYENVSLTENTSYSSIDIPVFVRYQNTIGSGKLSYFANVGAILSSFTSPSYTLSGTMTRKGYYPEYNVVLNDYPEYNFDNLTYSSTAAMELGAPQMMISGYLAAGAMYSVTNELLVKVGFSGTYGFTKVTPVIEDDFSNFHSSLILGNSSITSIGFEVGLVYRLSNK